MRLLPGVRDWPIQRKLFLIILAAIAASLLFVMAGIAAYEVTTYRAHLKKEIAEVGGFLAANSASAMAFDDTKTAQDILKTVKAEPEIVIAALYTSKGRVFASYIQRGSTVSLPAAPGPEGLRMAAPHIELVRTIRQKGLVVGTLYLRADMASLYSRLLDYAGIVTLVALALFGGALLLQVSLKRLISDPLLRLSNMARRIAGGDLGVNVPEDSGDEIGQLARTLNYMTRELARSYSELQRNIGQLEAANKELEAFSYSVSHDLRTPLRHIMGFVELFIKKTADLDETGRHYLEVISDSARKMGELIDDLLAFSRAGRAEITKQSFNLNELVREVQREFSVEIRERDVEWTIRHLPVVFGDPTLIRQVWANLISNALKFTRPVKHAIINIGYTDEGNRYVFFIRDNGVGFDMKYKDKLFGLFQRLHDPDELEGTGVGLANVRRIIHRHGGIAWAEGAPGKGAVFYFTLPKRSA